MRPWSIALGALLLISFIISINSLTKAGSQSTAIINQSTTGAGTADAGVSENHGKNGARVPNTFTALVIDVTDGDTIVVRKNNRPITIRLAGIDCPELKQDFGPEAAAFTESHVLGKTITVKVHTTDRYQRIVAKILLSNGKALNSKLLKAGLAWWYRHYSRDKTLELHEKTARNAQRGLWASDHPTPPWVYRREMRVAK